MIMRSVVLPVIISALAIALSTQVHGAKLKPYPDYIHICKRSDPHVEKCILQSIEKLRPQLRKGIPELDVPGIEPLVLPEVVVSRGEDASRFMAIGRNVKVYGPSDFRITKLKLDLSQETRPTIHLALNLPHLRFDGEYEINARVLVLPLKGRGAIKCNATNTKADAVIYGQTYKKGNNHYLRFIRMDMGLKIDDYNIHLDNLFGGDKILGEATNQALNQNKKEFIDALNPIVTRTTSEVILEIANKITKNHPYDNLFPK